MKTSSVLQEEVGGMGWRESELVTANDHQSSSVQNSQMVESPCTDTANMQRVRILQLNADYQKPFLCE